MRLIAYIVCLFFVLNSCIASITVLCEVSYKKEMGWSDDYEREVTFISGTELNRATTSFKYNSFRDYVLLFFSKDQVAILEMPSKIGGAGIQDFEFSHLESYYLFSGMSGLQCEQINSEYKATWNIKAKKFYNWIDPRLK